MSEMVKSSIAYREVVLLISANTLLLILPIITELERLLGSVSGCLFLVLASAFCLSEGLLNLEDPSTSFESLSKLDRLLPRLTGILLLSIFWISLIGALKVNTTSVTFYFMTIGTLMMIIGTFLRRAAMRTLGRQFKSTPTPIISSDLITNGIFSHLRHPSEAGLLMIAMGACILLGSIPGSLLMLVVLTPITLLRIQREETELRRYFGDAYDGYAANVRGLFPKLNLSH
jgi:protein-S-isoprenylcysteine O-methyltransferase Ste14